MSESFNFNEPLATNNSRRIESGIHGPGSILIAVVLVLVACAGGFAAGWKLRDNPPAGDGRVFATAEGSPAVVATDRQSDDQPAARDKDQSRSASMPPTPRPPSNGAEAIAAAITLLRRDADKLPPSERGKINRAVSSLDALLNPPPGDKAKLPRPANLVPKTLTLRSIKVGQVGQFGWGDALDHVFLDEILGEDDAVIRVQSGGHSFYYLAQNLPTRGLADGKCLTDVIGHVTWVVLGTKRQRNQTMYVVEPLNLVRPLSK